MFEWDFFLSGSRSCDFVRTYGLAIILFFFLMFAFVCCDFCDACCVVNVSWLDFFQFGGCIYVGTCLLRCRDY